MKKSKLAIMFGVLLALVLSAGAFAELVVTYTTSEDMWSEYTIEDTPERIAAAEANSLINNGAFTQWEDAPVVVGNAANWTATLGPADPWVFWRDTTAGWTAGRLHEVDLALPANPEGINNAMGWFIQDVYKRQPSACKVRSARRRRASMFIRTSKTPSWLSLST